MSEKNKRNFKGIWIPKEIWLDTNLSIMEKIFLVEIDSLDNEKGCFASNNYFAKFFCVTPQRCSQIINSLIKKGWLNVIYEKEGKEIVKRVLNILNRYKEKFKTVSNKFEEGIKKKHRGYKENVKVNNTVNNTSNNTINNKEKTPHKETYNEFVKLTAKEHDTLIADYGEDMTKEYIDRLNDYIGSTGKKYKSHYHVIKTWIRKEPTGDLTGRVKTDADFKKEYGPS